MHSGQAKPFIKTTTEQMGVCTAPCGSFCMLTIALLFSSIVTRVHASVYLDAPFESRVWDSVSYFDFEDTKWPFVGGGDMLIGPTNVLTSSSFDNFFIEYQTAEHNDQQIPENSTSVPYDIATQSPTAPKIRDPEADYEITTPPNFLIVEFGSSTYSTSLENIRHVADWMGADFVVLVVNHNASRKEKFMFWWSHKFPGIPDGALESEAQIVTQSGQCSFLAIGARQGAGKLDGTVVDSFLSLRERQPLTLF
jgi:hypothetical protein